MEEFLNSLIEVISTHTVKNTYLKCTIWPILPCTRPWDHRHNQEINTQNHYLQSFHVIIWNSFLLSLSPPTSNHQSTFSHYRFVHNLTVCIYFFLVWLLSCSIIILRFIHAVAYINNLFNCIAERYSIVWIYYNLCIYLLFPVSGFCK